MSTYKLQPWISSKELTVPIKHSLNKLPNMQDEIRIDNFRDESELTVTRR